MNQHHHRPRVVTILALAVLVLAVGNGVRFFTGLSRYPLLKELELSVPPEYLILSGAVWALAGLGLAVGLWRGMRIARTLALLLALTYIAQIWLDRLVLSAASTANLNWPFAALVHALAVGAIALILTRPGVRRFFDNGR